MKKMYAIIETGGKQYKVAEGETVAVEKLGLEKDAAVDFDKVLLVSNGKDVVIGKPYVKGAKVSGKIIDEQKDVKIYVQKFKRKYMIKESLSRKKPLKEN